ncbi:hypothetical protein GE21DRAFT_1277971 [Neurospora crassa]|nr:hypothetical protein GE21DRAFT_1277971 [Neurospora crassa]
MPFSRNPGLVCGSRTWTWTWAWTLSVRSCSYESQYSNAAIFVPQNLFIIKSRPVRDVYGVEPL